MPPQRIYKDRDDNQLTVLQRALRNVPGSGDLWAKYIRFLVCGPTLPGSQPIYLCLSQEAHPEVTDTGDAEQIPSTSLTAGVLSSLNIFRILGAYDRALATNLFVKDPEEIVPLVMARAGYEKRRLVAGEGEYHLSTGLFGG